MDSVFGPGFDSLLLHPFKKKRLVASRFFKHLFFPMHTASSIDLDTPEPLAINTP